MLENNSSKIKKKPQKGLITVNNKDSKTPFINAEVYLEPCQTSRKELSREELMGKIEYKAIKANFTLVISQWTFLRKFFGILNMLFP